VLAYFVDRIIAARRPIDIYVYKRKSGIRKLIEEVGIIEMVLFVATAWAYVAKHPLLGVALAFLLGLALSYFIDRIRQVRKKAQEAKQGAVAETINRTAAPTNTVSTADVTPTSGTASASKASVYTTATMGTVSTTDATPAAGSTTGTTSTSTTSMDAAPIDTISIDATPAPEHVS